MQHWCCLILIFMLLFCLTTCKHRSHNRCEPSSSDSDECCPNECEKEKCAPKTTTSTTEATTKKLALSKTAEQTTTAPPSSSKAKQKSKSTSNPPTTTVPVFIKPVVTAEPPQNQGRTVDNIVDALGGKGQKPKPGTAPRGGIPKCTPTVDETGNVVLTGVKIVDDNIGEFPKLQYLYGFCPCAPYQQLSISFCFLPSQKTNDDGYFPSMAPPLQANCLQQYSKFCVLCEDGSMYQPIGKVPPAAIAVFYPTCDADGNNTHMYMGYNLIPGKGSQAVSAGKLRKFNDSTAVWKSPYGAKIGKNSDYLKAVAVSCTGCQTLQQSFKCPGPFLTKNSATF